MLLVEDGREEEVCSSSPVRTPKLQLAVEQPWTGGQWNPPKKKKRYPMSKDKEETVTR